MPQQHLVAFCSDLGISATVGAAMLSVLLGMGFFSRQAWGWVSDRIGGLLTALISSVLQAAAMTGFLFTQDEAGLFTVSTAFGIGFSALIPAYVLTIRELYPGGEAHWRVPTLLFLSGSGMATGGWLAGYLYDLRLLCAGLRHRRRLQPAQPAGGRLLVVRQRYRRGVCLKVIFFAHDLTPKTGSHPGSIPGQAFSGSRARRA